VERLVSAYLSNRVIRRFDDSAVLPAGEVRVALSTDSYVVSPLFFPGGDVGCLAFNGTINDLAMVGARPLGITVGLILEEGLPLDDLDRIMASVGAASEEAGVPVVGGDTKVVERGSADGVFINTSGVGIVPEGLEISGCNARPGDLVILSGSIGDHGVAVLSRREGLDFETELKSDTAPLNLLVAGMLEAGEIHAMRDPTRGGLATSLNEIARSSQVGMTIDEARVPVREEVVEACEMLGFDPFYIANEGKLVAVVPPDSADAVLAAMTSRRYGEDASVVGEISSRDRGTVRLKTTVGGERILSPLSGELLPRIC
jgi:hydrogenase expression/formation protein HypE